jgi:hypothetical protein
MPFSSSRLAGIFLLVALIVALTMAGRTFAGDKSVEPWVGTAGVPETTAEIMSRQSTNNSGAWVEQDGGGKKHPRKKGNRAILSQNPKSPAVSSSGGTGSSTNSSPVSPESLFSSTINFTGATLADTQQSFPPDTMGAAGPSQFIIALNGRIRSFNKLTGLADGVLNADTDVFFQAVMTPPTSSNFTTDPRIRYDRLSGRWIIIMIDSPAGSLPNRVMLAVSSSGVITAGTVWTRFFFQNDQVSPAGDTGDFADYPTLGVDANALYIGVNVFASNGSFVNTTGFVVRKSSILANGAIIATAFRGLISNNGNGTGIYTPQGVDNFDPAATEGYFIGVDANAFGKLDLRRVGSPGGTPSLSANIAITVPTTAIPNSVPHLGNTGGANGNLDGLDDRLLGAHFRNGRLWTAHNVFVNNTGVGSSTGSRDAVRWYELQGIPTGQTPSIFESGTVFQASPSNSTDQRYYWTGTIMVSGQGHAAMGFSTAGANEHVNAGTTFRLATDALGTMQTPVLYTTSTTAYNPPGDTGGTSGRRWGDYSYTSLDPSDDMTMWTIQEFCDAQNSYGVRILKMLAPAPAIPTNCNPAVLSPGTTNLQVVLAGATTNGAGFFDPAAAIPNHILATVSGTGITVSSVSYTDPAHLTLTLTVSAGATNGPRAISVTNPDGQSVTSVSGLLTIAVSNHPPVLAAISNQTINEQTLLTFTAAATDPDVPTNTLTFSLDPGAPAGAAINATNGVFSWTPSEAQGPSTNSLTIRVTDNGSPSLSDTQTFTVTVNEVNTAPVLAAIANRVIHAGSTLVLTNTATDSDLPANTLTFSLDPGAPASMGINSASGILTWTPADNQAGTTNVLTVRVTDNGAPPLSNAKSFSVVVVPRPKAQEPVIAGGNVTISWSAIPGSVYRVQSAVTLTGPWTDLPGDVTASGPTATKVDVLAVSGQRFYRILLIQ